MSDVEEEGGGVIGGPSVIVLSSRDCFSLTAYKTRRLFMSRSEVL